MASPQVPLRPRRPAFRASFTLTLLYLFGFFILFALLLALPDLFQAVQQLPPGPEELTAEELELARQVARRALAGGRIFLAIGSAVVTLGLLAYLQVLPGLKSR
ncbi:MAG: hypothetical protein JRH01_19290 [Deltaproteobacteria bacterium]|nr:hypothetical protein [Deltaproteobacteria bacterium]MBW2393408.1 hypothetical protein [Deltaproteobacteria bacterium]